MRNHALISKAIDKFPIIIGRIIKIIRQKDLFFFLIMSGPLMTGVGVSIWFNDLTLPILLLKVPFPCTSMDITFSPLFPIILMVIGPIMTISLFILGDE